MTPSSHSLTFPSLTFVYLISISTFDQRPVGLTASSHHHLCPFWSGVWRLEPSSLRCQVGTEAGLVATGLYSRYQLFGVLYGPTPTEYAKVLKLLSPPKRQLSSTRWYHDTYEYDGNAVIVRVF